MLKTILGIALVLAIGNAGAIGLADISSGDASSGLKQALNEGSLAAVAKLGVQNGFFGNPKVKIPLPPSLQKVESAMRAFGMRKQADELVLTMNRAAEAAVPEAKQLLVDAVKKMSVQDAKGILTGGDTAALPIPNISSGRLHPISRSASCRSSRRPPTVSAWRSNTTRLPARA